MKTLTFALLALVACGQKKPPEAPAEPIPSAQPVAPAPAPEPEPEVMPEPEPEVEAPPPSNADFYATLSYAGGRHASGQVTRVERGEDWYAEDWTDADHKLTIPLESGSNMRDATWEEVKSIQVTYGKRDEISCQYDSAYSPWMYICVLPTQTTVKLKDGSTWQATGRHPWRFTYADGTVEEFYIYKLPARQQDTAENARTGTENYDLYGNLQVELMQLVGNALTGVTLQ